MWHCLAALPQIGTHPHAQSSALNTLSSCIVRRLRRYFGLHIDLKVHSIHETGMTFLVTQTKEVLPIPEIFAILKTSG
jgi:hypothetical protein